MKMLVDYLDVVALLEKKPRKVAGDPYYGGVEGRNVIRDSRLTSTDV